MENQRYVGLELKVGITAGIALLFLAIIIFTVEKFHFGQKGYPVDVSFQFVDAINPQADVYIGGGVKIGRVESIAVSGERVHLRVVINANVRIPSDAKFQILSKGLMGDKYLNVVAQTLSTTGEVLKPGASVEGVEPANIDKAFQRLGQVADSVRALFGDPSMKSSLSEMLRSLSSLSSRLDRIVANNEGNMNRSLKDFSSAATELNQFSQNLKDISEGIKAVLAEDNRENLAETLKNLRQTSGQLNQELLKISKGQGTLGVLLEDKQVAEDVKNLVRDVRENPWKLLWKQ
jgi:phospholipid/cholesterol/gamma-HCH transport system substrate-binding protein